jgi:hypothetical protein
VARAGALVVAGLVVVLGTGAILLDDEGNTRSGVPDLVVVVPMALGCLLATFGIVSLLNSVRMAYVLVKYPWIEVGSNFAEMRGLGTPNGQPVLTLSGAGREWRLTLAALRWRWSSFTEPTLVFAGRPGRGGVVAPPGRRTVAWAGRSPVTLGLSKLRAWRSSSPS